MGGAGAGAAAGAEGVLEERTPVARLGDERSGRPPVAEEQREGVDPELTPSRLAELTGLRASSVTALLDRLERRGMVTRQRSATDRRKIVIVPAHIPVNLPIFEAIEASAREVLDDYDDDQLAAFLDLYRRLNDLAGEHAARISRLGQYDPARAASGE